MKKILIALCFVALLVSSSTAQARVEHKDKPSDLSVLADVAFLRPVGAAFFVAEIGIFMAALPFSIITNSVGDTADVLLKKPFHYVFIRDVGDI